MASENAACRYPTDMLVLHSQMAIFWDRYTKEKYCGLHGHRMKTY